MNSPQESAPLEVDRLVTTDERRVTITPETHQAFRDSIATPVRVFDEIDAALDDEIELEVDPYVSGTNNRRSDKEIYRILDLIDNLPISDQGKEGTI